jgi:ubiquinone biosynthesis protein UbiJ
MTAFAADVDVLRRDTDALEQRIASIEKSSVT